MSNTLDAFNDHKYLNIETFRKSGTGVQTPVWFVRDGETLHIWTQADSGKAKRIRRDGRVRIAPSTASGGLLGEWLEARAEADASPQTLRHVQNLMKKKYGMAFLGFQLLGKLRRGQFTALRVRLPDEEN